MQYYACNISTILCLLQCLLSADKDNALSVATYWMPLVHRRNTEWATKDAVAEGSRLM